MSSSLIDLKDGGVTTHLLSTLASKGYKFLNTNGDWYYILGQKPEDGGGFPKKAIEDTKSHHLTSLHLPNILR